VIAVLPDHVVDQIAAGEVVERPASVVKELVENSLDAGARSVTIEVEAGGRALVRIVDDGSGMSPGDARLALSRHATSKLRHVDDLHDLVTMGFRGEALPSIASVSRLTLTTRRRGDLAAFRIAIDGGRITDVAEVGAPVGTTLEVRDLLHNVPARLKFLKGEATEASHITDAVVRLAMAHPQVHVRLRHGGRTAIEAPPCTSGVERVRSLLGPRLASRLHAVDGEENGVRVTAYLAAPELAQTTGRGVQLYVGRRSVRDRGLLHALTMGYGELVPRGRYPVAVVFVDCPAGVVDVNVHPQKLEVRFSDAQSVAAAVRHVVRRGVAQAPWLDEAAGASPVRMHAVVAPAPPRASDVAASYAAAAGRIRLGPAPLPAQETLDLARPVPAPTPSASWADRMRAAIASKPATAARMARAPEPALFAEVATATGSATATATEADTEAETEAAALAVTDADTVRVLVPAPTREPFFSRIKYLGQLDRTYLICEGDGELILIDQHAAHERVEFQRLRERSAAHEVPVQRLLFPTTIEVAPAEVAIAADAAELLSAAGFEVEPFGGSTVAMKAVPAGLRHAEPAAVLRELLGDLVEMGGSRAVDAHLDHVLATVACHSVVRAGDPLAPHEAESLLAQMDGVDFRAHCPHGRPVLLRMGIAEIARRFGR
jgi:DNA mismatch repair protein MutL